MIDPIKQRAIIEFVFKTINIHSHWMFMEGYIWYQLRRDESITLTVNSEKKEKHFNDRPHSGKTAAAMSEDVLITADKRITITKKL